MKYFVGDAWGQGRDLVYLGDGIGNHRATKLATWFLQHRINLESVPGANALAVWKW